MFLERMAAHLGIAAGWISPVYGERRRNATGLYRVLVALPVDLSVEVSYIGHLAEEAKA